MTVLLVTFEALRLLLRGMLVVLVLHFLRSAWTSARQPRGAKPLKPAAWPRVTIQLPVRNEYYVVERVIRAAAALDYPRDKLQIQVLDDSTDATRDRAKALTEALRAEGIDIEYVARERPVGFKAGALNNGLRTATGEFLAMFDADCVPAPDFLQRVIPYFSESDVGCVQVCWSFSNRNRSLLTRVQAIVLDGLFVVDQFARARAGMPLQFNGTNGVWRRSAIEAAGGWGEEILAEDADLSFRAYLVGQRVVHVRDYAVPTEIPEDMAAFRAQQRRWALGSAQMLRSLSLRILRARIPLRAKFMMFMHMGRHAIDPLILLACLTSPFTTLYDMPYLIDYGTWSNAGVMVLVGASCAVFYGAALKRSGARLREVLLTPLVIALAIGLSLVYTLAFVSGIFSRGGSFVRTPKAGDEAVRSEGPRYLAPRDAVAVLEVLLAGAHVYFAWRAASVGIWAYAGFFAAVAASFGWVGLGTLSSVGVGRTTK